jgi:hypothetical protein
MIFLVSRDVLPHLPDLWDDEWQDRWWPQRLPARRSVATAAAAESSGDPMAAVENRRMRL